MHTSNGCELVVYTPGDLSSLFRCARLYDCVLPQTAHVRPSIANGWKWFWLGAMCHATKTAAKWMGYIARSVYIPYAMRVTVTVPLSNVHK